MDFRQSHKINVRRSTPTDAPHIIAGINQICAEGGAFFTQNYIPTPQWESALHHLEGFGRTYLIVAEWNGTFAGVGRLFPSTTAGDVELGIFVLQPYRCKGIGLTIMHNLIEWAKEQQMFTISLEVIITNKVAILLYNSLDFVQLGNVRQKIIQGVTHQYIVMQRPL